LPIRRHDAKLAKNVRQSRLRRAKNLASEDVQYVLPGESLQAFQNARKELAVGGHCIAIIHNEMRKAKIFEFRDLDLQHASVLLRRL
jgi:hypothetical protein